MNRQDYYNKMKAPGDARPTWMHGVLQIHVTRACDLACIGCTQGSNLGGKPVVMTPAQFEEAVISVKDYHGVVGIFGGNPCLHPKFEELCAIITKHIPMERRGLWSNNLNGHGVLCSKTFNPYFSNLNVHTDKEKYAEMKRDWPASQPKGLEDSRHSPPYVAMRDMEDLTETQMLELISGCDINQLWSAMICVFRGELRGFFCEIAGAQSMLHQHEPDYPDTGVKIDSNWWRRPIGDFSGQIDKHCFDCGIPLRGAGGLAINGTDEFVSRTHEKIYKLKRGQGKTVHLVHNTKELGGNVNRATDYIENGVVNVGNENVKILIGVPTLEVARQAMFYDYLYAMEKPIGTVMTFSHGQSPARGRNLIIEQAIANRCTHILFVDDDVIVKPDTLMRLLKHDKDIVSGLYLMRNFPHKAIAFKVALEDGRCQHYFPADEDHGLHEIVATGLGCCLIKTSVFEKLEKPYIRLGELEKDHWCDDIGFFRRVREAGIKMYLDLDAVAGHMATVTIWPNRAEDKWDKDNLGGWLVAYDTMGESRVQFPIIKPAPEPVGV